MSDYYFAYDLRYRQAHANGVSWMGKTPTPIVTEVLHDRGIGKTDRVLEIGCGEGRDALPLLKEGYDLFATDCSIEAIRYCKQNNPQYAERFAVLDVLKEAHARQYDAIIAVAVLHMLVKDADRDGFYSFIRTHLKPNGIALICSMGDGTFSMQTDPKEAFALRERSHPSGTMTVAATTCRIVSSDVFRAEIARNGLKLLEEGITSSPPEFDKMLYAVVKA